MTANDDDKSWVQCKADYTTGHPKEAKTNKRRHQCQTQSLDNLSQVTGCVYYRYRHHDEHRRLKPPHCFSWWLRVSVNSDSSEWICHFQLLFWGSSAIISNGIDFLNFRNDALTLADAAYLSRLLLLFFISSELEKISSDEYDMAVTAPPPICVKMLRRSCIITSREFYRLNFSLRKWAASWWLCNQTWLKG